MRTRTATLAACSAAATLFLGACTSGPEEPAAATGGGTATVAPDEAVPVDAVGETAAPDANGYLCRYVTGEAQAAAAGAELQDPYEIVVADADDAWACEARDGEEALIRVSILRGEQAWDEQRDLAQDADGVTDGPPYLGESYVSPRRVTGLTLCVDPTAPDTYEPYALVVEALGEEDADLSTELGSAASAMARTLDISVGCSPKMARGEVPSATSAP